MTDTLVSTYRRIQSNESLLTDRMEYSEDDLSSAYPYLSHLEIHILYLLLQLNGNRVPAKLLELLLLLNYYRDNQKNTSTRAAILRIIKEITDKGEK